MIKVQNNLILQNLSLNQLHLWASVYGTIYMYLWGPGPVNTPSLWGHLFFWDLSIIISYYQLKRNIFFFFWQRDQSVFDSTYSRSFPGLLGHTEGMVVLSTCWWESCSTWTSRGRHLEQHVYRNKNKKPQSSKFGIRPKSANTSNIG